MQSVFPSQADAPDGLPAGAVTPLPSSRRSVSPGNRKETILSLVEMLLQGDGDGDGDGRRPSGDEEKDIPNVDEHMQMLGAETFNKFQRRVNQLDNELRKFANAARQLGSSVAILSSAFHLRERLAQILFLYRENAADLFPRKVTHLPKDSSAESAMEDGRRRKTGRQVKAKTPLHVANARPAVDQHLDLEFFPEQLEALATDVATFLHCLNEFPEFTDEGVNASIRSFEGDLKYWASCLRDFSGHFRYPSVQRYMHDLSAEMGDHLDSITSSLSTFIEVGVPMIRFAQKHGANNLLNLSTVATFFSAVTATTLQFSFELPHSASANAVNCLWFQSMVFSIAAAVNSLLGVTWKQAMYRSPGHRVPWWVLIWIKRSPLVFLVMSVACFSIGLCCFAYATNQAGVTSTLTTVFTAFTSFGLTAVSAWFASERVIFSRHRGQKWLGDVLNEYWALVTRMPGMKKLRNTTHDRFGRLASFIQRVYSRLLNLGDAHSTSSEYTDDLEANVLPIAQSSNFALSSPGLGSPNLPGKRDVDAYFEPPRSPPLQVPNSSTLSNEKELQPPASSVSPGRQLWKNALRTVQMHNNSTLSQTVGVVNPREPCRRRTTSSNFGAPADRFRSVGEEVYRSVVQRSRIAALTPKLTALEPTQELNAHSGLVRYLQFSPDGKYLATASWDRTSVVFRVGEPFSSHRVLAHPQGFVSQVAWSPDGRFLLTRLTRHIRVWTADEGVCIKTMDRGTSIESVTWFPYTKGDERALISVEGSDVHKLDLDGNIIDSYNFGRMKLHAVAVTPDSLRLIGVGPLLESPSGLQPSKSRAEKRLIVYNMETKQYEHQTPVLHDVRNITAVKGRGGTLALVSYENKAPPQLWKLEIIKDRDTNSFTGRLILKHTYMPKAQVDFVGTSYFGGENNELVICAGKAGDIHIWDQESGAQLHSIKGHAHTHAGDLTCIAWNHACNDPFMFAAGSHEGIIRIWSMRPDEGFLPTEGRMIPRTHSPLDFNDLESLPSHATQDPDSQPTELMSQPTFSTRTYRSRARGLTATTMGSRANDDYGDPSRPMTLPQRILAYAAAQHAAAEAQAVEPIDPPGWSPPP